MDQSADRNPLDVVAEEFSERCRRGEQPSIDEYTQRYPHFAAELRELLPPVAMMEELKRRKAAATTQVAPVQLRRLGDFQIVREIGRGGMGIVYEAEQKALGRRVALKVLPRHFLLDTKRLQRFEREAQAAARLHHTNIVPVFGVGECDGLHYYVMQYVQGQGLNEVLAQLRCSLPLDKGETQRGFPPVPSAGSADTRYWQWVARVGVQVADALQYAHEQGILHRDIKPANIVLDTQGTVWITDFGLAKVSEQSDLTASGDIVGTLQYMAPEMLQSQADARSDVCSLGLTLYELLALSPPYGDASPTKLLRQIVEEEPAPLRRANPLIPRDLETIVLKASARHPEQRYQSAAELAHDLRRFLDDRPIEARQASPQERLWRWCRRNRAVASLSVAAVAFLLLALVVGWIGYVKTTEALAQESQRRQDADAATARAEAATRRAEANVRMSLQALEEMFDQIETGDELLPLGPPPPSGPAALGWDGPQARPPGPGRPPAPERIDSKENAALLQSILKFYDKFVQENATDSRLQAEAAKAHRRVGDIQQRLGELNKAQSAYARALEIATRLHAGAPANADYTLLLSEAHGRVGMVLRRGKPQDAEQHFRQALALTQSLAGSRDAPSPYLLNLSLARFALGEFLAKQLQPKEARPLVEEAIAEMQSCLQSSQSAWPRPRLERLLGIQHRCLSELLHMVGEHKAADDARRKAEELGVGPPSPRPRHDPRQPARPGPWPHGEPGPPPER